MTTSGTGLKIAHILSHTSINGVGTSLAVLMRELEARGHKLMLVHRPDCWLAEQMRDLPVEFHEAPLHTRYKELYDVGDTIRRWQADVIHTHGSTAHKYGAIYRVAGRIPVVATAHACHFQLHWIFNHRVIAPSQITADYHHRVNRVRRRNLRIIHHPFDVATAPVATTVERSTRRTEIGLPQDAFVLGMTGDLCRRKNQMDCVKVLEALRGHGVDAHLVLIGVGADREYVGEIREAIDGELEPYVHRLGLRHDAVELLAALDAYLCTSIHEEGPIATIEAMSRGLPVITTTIGCMPALLGGGRGGRMFVVGDNRGMAEFATELANDATRRRAIGAEAREVIIENLAPAAIVPKIEAVYREVVRNKGRVRHANAAADS